MRRGGGRHRERGVQSDAMARNPFQVLGLPPRYDLSAADIERAYLTLASQLHPDAPGATEFSPAAGAEETNRARQILKNPEARGNALLEVLGGSTKEQDRSLPAGLLAEMMEVRGEMESAGQEDRRRWEQWAEQRRAEHEQRVGALFASVAREGASADRLRAIRLELNAWRYIERMLEQVSGPGGL